MPDLPRAAVDERLPRTARLRLRPEFERCYREGRRAHGTGFTLHWRPSTEGTGAGPGGRDRLAQGRRLGDASPVEALDARGLPTLGGAERALASCDLLVHFKPGAAPEEFARFRGDLERLLGEVARRRGRG